MTGAVVIIQEEKHVLILHRFEIYIRDTCFNTDEGIFMPKLPKTIIEDIYVCIYLRYHMHMIHIW